jgi:hypothetical protein
MPPRLALGQQTRTAEVMNGLLVSYSSTWAPAKQQNPNAFNLVTPPNAATADAVSAVINITTEVRQNHAEAVQELREMASGLPKAPKFLTIDGWPALQARGLVPTTREEQLEKKGHQLDSQGRPLVRRAATVIAADNIVVRIEGALTPQADARLLDQVDAIAQHVRYRLAGDATNSTRELQQLRKSAPPHALGSTRSSVSAGRPPAAMSGNAAPVFTGFGEFEIAASSNGQNVVIAGNSGTAFSTNFGQGFTATQPIANSCASGGDLSLAWSPNGGSNGTFYLSFLANTSCAGGTPNAIALASSTSNGQTFAVISNPVLGAVDQPHIAVDPRQAAAGTDQVYIVYKSEGGPLGTEQAAIVCSSDSGKSWSAPVAVGAMGDNYPRITVGQDGIVYVTSRAVMNGNVRIFPFTACASNPKLTPGASWFVAVDSGRFDVSNCGSRPLR